MRREESARIMADSVSAGEAGRIARECFGLDARARRMDGFADASFRLETERSGLFVLKVSPVSADRGVLEMQNAMLRHLGCAALMVDVPVPVADLAGREISEWLTPDAGQRAVRLFRYLSGQFACDGPLPDAPLLRSVGRGLAQIDKALLDFEHPAALRTHAWDLSRTLEACADAPLTDETRRLVEPGLTGFREHVLPALQGLRRSTIHGDVNDHNLLVGNRPGRGHSFSGLIDFGDALFAPTVFDLAIALAYFMMRQSRPLLAAQEVVAAFHSVLPLEENELAVLYDLVCARLCMSLCHAARGRKAEPGNAYLTRSEHDAKNLLARLGDTHRIFAVASFRDACSMTPWPAQQRLASWLAKQKPAPLVEGIGDGASCILDFTPRSADLGGAVSPPDLASFSELLRCRLAGAGASAGIGRYGEVRGLYQSEVFAPDSADEPRTVHLGVDIFVPSGTEVRAPLAGVVHSFADNALPLDYGPTIILAHEGPEPSRPFYTLYGHLSRASLHGLAIGDRIGQGQEIARIGDAEVNGGWPPHLHFQLIGDMLGRAGDFPGVARHSEAGVWKSLCPNPARFVGLSDAELDAQCGASPVALARRRDCCLSPSLSVAFSQPIKVVRGRGAYLFTEQGERLLDLVNNVAHVGHAHPHVVKAIQDQEALLNTNTRYLHDGLVSYAERLTALMPASLDTCFLVCSGSEANDLALRLARAHSGGHDVVVVGGGYHGNLSAMVDLSPYKFDGPGGGGRPVHVQVAAMPDEYNGEFAGRPEAGALYAASVARAFARIADAGRVPAAFMCESALGCGGQIILPDGYLAAAFRRAREAGAVCIADEVQVGFGRLGKHLWAFEHQGALPDIVTLGKPIGNGYPLAAVVTTRAIAESFANGMEYFNTYGGNPVACAAGHAVLDVIEGEGLVSHADRLGRDWLAALKEMAAGFPLVGDVRGCGLFIGLELVSDRHTRAPAPSEARQIIEILKDLGIQISVDGPRYNVLKIKPPMVINSAEADRVVDALRQALTRCA